LELCPKLRAYASVYHRRNVLPTWLEKGRRSERDILDRRRSTKLTIPPSFDACPLVYHSNHQAVSTAQFRCAGQLATADTCLTEMSIHYACFDRFFMQLGSRGTALCWLLIALYNVSDKILEPYTPCVNVALFTRHT